MIETPVIAFVLILVTAALVAIAVKVVPVPYVTALAVAGIAAGWVLGPSHVHLTPDLILFILLPGLLFEAAFNLSWSQLRTNLAAVGALATVGVVLTTGVVAVLGHAALGLTIPVAVLFGAMVAPTDPVAVVAVFRRLHVPERLVNLVDAESLLNDGTGVILFTVALAATADPAHVSLAASLVDLLRLAVGGLALGLALGLGLSLVTGRIDDFHVEMTLTALAAYGGYLLADLLHVSGILTVVVAGLVLGNYGRPHGMSEQTRRAVDQVWDYVAFVLNSVVFLLIGLDVPLGTVAGQAGVVLAASVIVLAARAAVVYLLLGLLHLARSGVPLRWQHLTVWGGLRGTVALALALSVAGSGGQLRLVSALAYGVVVVSILVQGGTVGLVTRTLLGRPPGRGG